MKNNSICNNTEVMKQPSFDLLFEPRIPCLSSGLPLVTPPNVRSTINAVILSSTAPCKKPTPIKSSLKRISIVHLYFQHQDIVLSNSHQMAAFGYIIDHCKQIKDALLISEIPEMHEKQQRLRLQGYYNVSYCN